MTCIMDQNINTKATNEVTKKKVYALLVGINRYPAHVTLEEEVSFPPLHGCVTDATRMRDYLRHETLLDSNIVLLTDEKATKSEIIHHFREHLGQAKAGDTALFFYSGHGAQEWADPVWTSETDHRLECLACYYDEQTKDNFLLADKELRYLVHELAAQQPHIVTIFDCCHSADVTRNGAMVTAAFGNGVEKRIPFFVFGQRGWGKFIFSTEITKDNVKHLGVHATLPEGAHVQFSACESDEAAIESAGEGVFTKTLLRVLRMAGGDVSYQALSNRVRQYMRNVFEQKPRLYITPGNESVLEASFLNRTGKLTKAVFGEVTFNDKKGWHMNLGSLHGIGRNTRTIQVVDPLTPSLRHIATVCDIYIDYCRLEFTETLSHERIFLAHVEGILSQSLLVHVKNEDGLLEDQEQLLDALTGVVALTEHESEASYVVRCRSGQVYITYPNDPFRPLVAPLNASVSSTPLLLAKHFKHISQWEYRRLMRNDDATAQLREDGLQIVINRILGKGAGQELEITNNEIVLEPEKIDGRWTGAIKVQLTNITPSNLYCCALLLSSDFGAYMNYLSPAVYTLGPNEQVELKFNGGSTLFSTVHEKTLLYNWSKEQEYLQFIFSEEPFEGQSLALAGLPLPLPRPEQTRSAENTQNTQRGMLQAPMGIDIKAKPGWKTKLIGLNHINPEYNSVDQDRLKAGFEDPALADFMVGLYYEGVVQDDLSIQYAFKSNLQQSKSIFQDKVLDLANWWARRRRNRHYKDVTTHYPNRVKIVAEGDSWFEHPLVLDIIDHLSKVYAIYCVSAAGDTLRNYLSANKKNGEFYLDALNEHKPKFFLISGGGNDILGPQFQTFLKDDPDLSQPEGQNPERFLKQLLWNELASLMSIYKTWFGNLLTHNEEIHVIVHGYDYPAKLNDRQKGWLGRYMFAKGIDRAGDRTAIIHLIMDRFNKQLEEAAKDFPNVTYIDVRNTVRYNESEGEDQWYDEIHPNDKGSQQVALRFMQQIDRKHREDAQRTSVASSVK
jgi:hypothetical protein